jgi:hypothetical protein
MLTAEDQKRIEDEEKHRIAEEQYRAEVRARLQPPPTTRRRTKYSWLLGVCIVAVIITLLLISLNARRGSDPAPGSVARAASSAAPRAPSIRYVPVTQKIASGQVAVRAHGYVLYRIEVQPSMRAARVSGSFNASGGIGNDVAVVIATEPEFANWINGHQANVFYATGRKTTGSFDVQLAPGRYCFAINNTFSLISQKYVFLDVNLDYQRIEMY